MSAFDAYERRFRERYKDVPHDVVVDRLMSEHLDNQAYSDTNDHYVLVLDELCRLTGLPPLSKYYSALPGRVEMIEETLCVSPKGIAEKVIEFLDTRKGFDHWWHDIDPATKADILKGISDLVWEAAYGE